MFRAKNPWFAQRKQQFADFSVTFREREASESTANNPTKPSVDEILREFVPIPYGDEENSDLEAGARTCRWESLHFLLAHRAKKPSLSMFPKFRRARATFRILDEHGICSLFSLPQLPSSALHSEKEDEALDTNDEDDDVVVLTKDATEVVLQATRRAENVTSNAMAASVRNYGQPLQFSAISVASSSAESDSSEQEEPFARASHRLEARNESLRGLHTHELVIESREGDGSYDGGYEDDGSCVSISYPSSEQEDDCSEEDASDSDMKCDTEDDNEHEDDNQEDSDEEESSEESGEGALNASAQRRGSITNLRWKSQIHQANCSGTTKLGDSESPDEESRLLGQDISSLLEEANELYSHSFDDAQFLEKQKNKKRKFAELTKWAATGCIVAAGVAAAYLASQQYDAASLVRSVVSDFTR